MHQPEAAFFQFPQKFRQHLRGMRLRIVEQDDAPADLFEARQDEVAFGRRGCVVPVGGPDVRAENREALFLQIVEQRGGVGEARKTEKRRACAAGGGCRRRNPSVDVRPRRSVSHLSQRLRRVAEGMMADAVPLVYGPLHQRRRLRRIMADDEEGRARAFGGERVEDFARRPGRSVVERQNDFVIGEIERPRVGLETDSRWLAPADCQRARDPERVRTARRSGDGRTGRRGADGERHKSETKTG